MKPFTYRVVEGDSLLVIAQKFGITPETVLWANEIPNPEVLVVGQELTILPISGVQHRVAAGDTVASIAEMYCAEPVMIRGINGLAAGEEPREGVTLIIPGGMRRTPDVFEPPPDSRPSEPLPPDSPSYTVRPGDTLVSVADAFGVRPSAIQAANGLMDPDLLQVGQLLVVPGGTEPHATTAPSATAQPVVPTPVPTAQPPEPAPAPPSPSPAAATSTPAQATEDQVGRYTVKQGDTLYSIARAAGVSPSALASVNAISDPGKLTIGQLLVIPGAGAADAPTAAQPTATEEPTAAPPTATPQATAVPTTTPAAPAPTATSTPPIPTAVPTLLPAPPSRTAAPPAAPPPGGGSTGDRIAAIAQKYLGFRYVWGGDSPAGFDCSGFTWYVYREAGITIPQHDLDGQLRTGQKIDRDKLLPGDLVFFENTYMKGLSHVGIYLGNGRFINAETETTGVQIRSLSDPNWASRYVGASRPW